MPSESGLHNDEHKIAEFNIWGFNNSRYTLLNSNILDTISTDKAGLITIYCCTIKNAAKAIYSKNSEQSTKQMGK